MDSGKQSMREQDMTYKQRNEHKKRSKKADRKERQRQAASVPTPTGENEARSRSRIVHSGSETTEHDEIPC